MKSPGARERRARQDMLRIIFLICMAIFTLALLIGAFGVLSEVRICWTGC